MSLNTIPSDCLVEIMGSLSHYDALDTISIDGTAIAKGEELLSCGALQRMLHRSLRTLCMSNCSLGAPHPRRPAMGVLSSKLVNCMSSLTALDISHNRIDFNDLLISCLQQYCAAFGEQGQTQYLLESLNVSESEIDPEVTSCHIIYAQQSD